MNCWEFNKCGREAGGRQIHKLGICPSYPDHGQCCARIAGTFQDGEVHCILAKVLTTCVDCGFHESEHYTYKVRSTG